MRDHNGRIEIISANSVPTPVGDARCTLIFWCYVLQAEELKTFCGMQTEPPPAPWASHGPQGRSIGRAAGVGRWELVGELSKEPLASALEAADAAHVRDLSSAELL